MQLLYRGLRHANVDRLAYWEFQALEVLLFRTNRIVPVDRANRGRIVFDLVISNKQLGMQNLSAVKPTTNFKVLWCQTGAALYQSQCQGLTAHAFDSAYPHGNEEETNCAKRGTLQQSTLFSWSKVPQWLPLRQASWLTECLDLMMTYVLTAIASYFGLLPTSVLDR